MNNTVLRLLKIFQEETDSEHMLTKAEIIGVLEEEGYETINEKQFYRKIEELRDNDYNIEVKKGRQTKYFLRKNRLNKEEWIFLLSLILGSKDISNKETKRIIDCLEEMSVCFKSVDYAEEYKEKIVTEKSKFNQLGNFHVLLKAIDEERQIECKQVKKVGEEYKFSELLTLKPYSFTVKDSRIVINFIQNDTKTSCFLGELIDVEII